MEIKDEEESLDGSSPTRDQEEDCIIPAKSERLDTTVVEGEDQERVDVSSDEENHSVSFMFNDIFQLNFFTN